MANYITKELTIIIEGDKARLDEPLYLFQTDKNIDIYFTIKDLKFDFFSATQTVSNVIEKTNASYATIRVLKPETVNVEDRKVISEGKIPIKNNRVLFTVTKDFIDQTQEIGVYKLQISLYDEQYGKITIPYITFEVLEPIFPEDYVENIVDGQIDITKIGMSRISNMSNAQAKELINRGYDTEVLGWNENTIADWNYGEIIDATRMNRINTNIKELWSTVGNIGNNISTDASNVKYVGNQSFSNVKEVLDFLLYTPIEINNLNISIDKILEKGRQVDGCVLSWTTNKTPTEITITVNGNSYSIGNTDITYSYNSVIQDNTSFTLNVRDERTLTSKAINIIYCNKIFWGNSSSTTYDTSFFSLLQNSTLSDNKSRQITVTAVNNEYIYYALPSRLGVPIFKVGGFEGGFEKVSTFSLRNNYLYTEDYDIYKSVQPNLGLTTVDIF